MLIFCKDRFGNNTIYKANKAKQIDNTLYFISEGEISFMSDKMPEPMYIDFETTEEAADYIQQLYSFEKIDLTRLNVSADIVADYNERKSMDSAERADFAMKVAL